MRTSTGTVGGRVRRLGMKSESATWLEFEIRINGQKNKVLVQLENSYNEDWQRVRRHMQSLSRLGKVNLMPPLKEEMEQIKMWESVNKLR